MNSIHSRIVLKVQEKEEKMGGQEEQLSNTEKRSEKQCSGKHFPDNRDPTIDIC